MLSICLVQRLSRGLRRGWWVSEASQAVSEEREELGLGNWSK